MIRRPPISTRQLNRRQRQMCIRDRMSLWYLSDAVAQAINAQIIRFYTPKTEVNYFIAVGIVSIVFGILLLFGVKKISALMGDSK